MDNPSTTPNPYGDEPRSRAKLAATVLMAVIGIVLLALMVLLLSAPPSPPHRASPPGAPRLLLHR